MNLVHGPTDNVAYRAHKLRAEGRQNGAFRGWAWLPGACLTGAGASQLSGQSISAFWQSRGLLQSNIHCWKRIAADTR